MNIKIILEIAVYELIDIVPNMILALLPFHRELRLSVRKTAAFGLLFYSLAILSRALALRGQPVAAAMTVFWVVCYLVFYAICIRADIRKQLFVLLILLNFGSFTAIIFSHLVYHQLIGIMDHVYSFSSSIVLGIIYLCSFPLLYTLMDKKLRPLMEYRENSRVWNYLWLVPATFCLSYYYNLYANGGIVLFSSKLTNTLFAVFFNLGSLFVTYLIICLLEQNHSYVRLKEENYFLSMQSVQYENLRNRIEDARQARHDLRQTLTIIQSFAQDGDLEGMNAYIGQYVATLSLDSPIHYCDNYVLNALLVYHERLFREAGIRFEAAVDYAGENGIADTDLVILFGNLLENAVEACKRKSKGETFLTLHMKKEGESIVVTLDNSYEGTIRCRKGILYSSKTGEPGLGTESIRKVVKKYNGVVRFTYDPYVFHASLLLCPGGQNETGVQAQALDGKK